MAKNCLKFCVNILKKVNAGKEMSVHFCMKSFKKKEKFALSSKKLDSVPKGKIAILGMRLEI